MKHTLWNKVTVWFASLRFLFHVFFFFFFFFSQPVIVNFVNGEQYIYVLFTIPQITLFSNFFIKNVSHNTIYTFKNYFATVFSVSAKISSIQTRAKLFHGFHPFNLSIYICVWIEFIFAETENTVAK